jgi:hypothetical protein
MRLSIMLLSIVAVCYSQNILQNPGFESWTGGLPDNWEHSGGIYVFQENVVVHGGNHSVCDSCITQNQASADLQQGRFVVSSSTQYRFSVWVYDNDPAGRVRLGICWFPDGSDWSSMYTHDSTEWQELAMDALSPADADSALVLVRAYDVDTSWDGDAVFYVDDASFIALPNQPPVIVRIWHNPMHPPSGFLIDTYGWVSDNGLIVADTLFYGINNLTNPYALLHVSAHGDTFRFQIPGQSEGDTIFYYHKYVDEDGLVSMSDTFSLYVGELDIYLNELFYDSESSDSGCYIEIFKNGGTSLDGYSIVGINGNNGGEYANIELSGHAVPGDGFFVIARDSTVSNFDLVTRDADLENGPDNVELRFNGITIDALGYGSGSGWHFTGEWLPAPDVASGHCLGRYPDGSDTDNNLYDFEDYTVLTPGAQNPAVQVREHRQALMPLSIQMNPVKPTHHFSMMVADRSLYPVTIYSVAGQHVKSVLSPDTYISLSSGVYFIKTSVRAYTPTKFIVVR